MRIESLTRLINAADWMSFRNLVVEFLVSRGYTDPFLTDGWRDGGVDCRFVTIPPNPANIAIQISVEKDWRAKLWQDVRKVKANYNYDRFILISSRIIPESDFQEESTNIWKDLSVSCSKIDCQALASGFVSAGTTLKALSILGIDLTKPRTLSTLLDRPQTEAAAAYLFFSKESIEFRTNLIRSTIISSVSSSETPLKRPLLVSKVCETLQIPADKKQLIESSVDRMLQLNELQLLGGELFLFSKIAENYKALRLLRENEQNKITERISNLLTSAVPARRVTPDICGQILECAGSLLIDSSLGASRQLRREWELQDSIGKSIRDRLRNLHSILDALGFPSDDRRDQLCNDVVRILSSSEIGKQLISGELYLAINHLEASHMAKALGGEGAITTILDASVAIPIICGLLYETTGNRFGFGSTTLYELAVGHDLDLMLPKDYLEETSAHLILAYRDYSALIGQDETLTGSENAFVAHFSAISKKFSGLSFSTYLASFGLVEQWQKADLNNDDIFRKCKFEVSLKLENLFSRYGIDSKPLFWQSDATRKDMEQSVAYAIRDLELTRPHINTEHDTRTLAFLKEQDNQSDIVYILCTWDTLHLRINSEIQANWLALDPAVLSDLLSICSFDSSSFRPATPLSFIKSFSEETTRNAAKVWDSLASYERGGFSNAELIDIAKRFKAKYMEENKRDFRKKTIVHEWEQWKSR
jgi:hypothetical protein